MTQAEYHSYRFNSRQEPTDEQLNQLMENAAEKVRATNHESDERFFSELRSACRIAKERGTNYNSIK